MIGQTKLELDEFDIKIAVALSFILQIEEDEAAETQANLSADIFLDTSDNKSEDSILDLIPSSLRERPIKLSQPPQPKEPEIIKEDPIKTCFENEINETKYSDIMNSGSEKTFDSDVDVSISHNPITDNARRSKRLKQVEKDKKERAERLMISKSALTRFSRSSPLSGISAKKLISSWNEMHKHTLYWMRKFYAREQFSKTALHAHFLNSLSALKRSLSTARARPAPAHQSIMQFVTDFVKMYELAYSKGFKEVIGSIFKLVEHILGIFLAGDRNMSATSLPWMQSREVLCLLFSTMLRAETIYGFLQLIGKTQLYFIDRWTKRKIGRNDEFVAFAISEMSSFTSILSRRLSHLAVRNKYGLPF